MSTTPTSIVTFLSNLLSNPNYTGSISDTSSMIVSELPLLQLDLPSIGSITSTDGTVTVGVSALAADKGILDKVTGGFAVSDTVANIVSSLGVLSSDGNIVSVTGTGGQVNVNVAAFRANQAGLDKITGGFLVADTAANIGTNFDSLAADPLLLSITATDNAAVPLNAGQVANDGSTIAKLHNADATPYRLAVSDVASAIQSALPALENQASHIVSITPTAGTVTVSTAVFGSNQAVLDKVVGGFAISDTAADVKSALPSLAGDGAISSITATDGPVSVTTGQFAADRPALDKIVGGFAVSDTAAAVLAALPSLGSDSNIASITTTDAPLSVSTATFAANEPALDKVAGGFAVSDTVAAVQAALPLLSADSHVASITATGGPVNVSSATFTADQAALDKIVGGFTVSGPAAAILSVLPSLAADTHLTAVTAIDTPLTVSAAMFAAATPALDKVAGGFVVSDTVAAVQAALPSLAADSHVSSIMATGGTVSVSTADFGADQPALDKIAGGFMVSDVAGAIEADLPALANDGNVAKIMASGGTVSVSTTDFAADHAALDKIVGGFSISDTASAVETALPALTNDNAVSAITATDAPVTVSVATATAAKAALDKVTGGFVVSDTAAAIGNGLVALASDPNIATIASTTGQVSVEVAEVQALQPALAKLSGGYIIDGLAPGDTVGTAGLPYKASFQALFQPDTGVLQIIDTAAGNAVVAQRSFSGSFSGNLFTLGSDGSGNTTIGLTPYALATYAPGDLAFSSVNGQSYIAAIQHYPHGQITGVTYDYATATGSPFTGYVSAADGIEQFAADGSGGVQALVGLGDNNVVTTANAAGSGAVLVDLKDGAISRGGQLDATLQNVDIAQLGAGPSTVLGFTAHAALIYGGPGDLSVYGEGGNDYIQGGSGANAIVGGTGNEVFYGNGGTDTMLGGSGANFMQAGASSSSVDMFTGTGGADFVYGRGGATVLQGGSGTEYLSGGTGRNTLIGSTTSHSLNVFAGGAGADTFYAGIGTNLMYEGAGQSTFHGGSGTDAVAGGSGQSTVIGGTGTLFVSTGAGDQDVTASTGLTNFYSTVGHLTAGRLDTIDNFQGAHGSSGTFLYLPGAVADTTSFSSQNGGTAITTAVAGGQAQIFVAGAAIASVQAQTHFTL